MSRDIGAVAAGAAVWAALWLGMNAVLPSLFPETIVPGSPLDASPLLLFLILYSVALSVLAGYTTAAVKGGDFMGAVWALAGLQLTLGVVAQVSYWDLFPVWYHVIFLGLIVPATVYGGRLREKVGPTDSTG
ncbi:MAG: hypothetical protein R3304_00865 [Longimicrobiales bacterium]|nr:hypothetical protein [Longimicrobiales bacterium]